MPTPTKLIWFGNSNSLLGNAKWSFDVVQEHAAPPGRRLLQRVVLDELLRVLGHRVPGRLVGRVQAPGHDGELHEPVPARVPDDAARAHPRHAVGLRDRSPASPRRSARSSASRAWPTTGEGVLDGDPTPYLQRDPRRLERDPRLPVRRAARELRERRAVPHEQPHLPARTSAGSSVRRTSPGTRRRAGSSSTGRSPSGRRPASRSRSGASPSTRPSTSRTRSSRTRITRRSARSTPEDYGVPEEQTDVETRQTRNVVRTWAGARSSKHPLTRAGSRLPVRLPDAEVPLGRALDRGRLGLDRDALRPLRRHLPPRRRARPGRARRTPRSTRPTRRSSDWATGTTSGSTRTRRTARTATAQGRRFYYEVARVMMRVRVFSGHAAGA